MINRILDFDANCLYYKIILNRYKVIFLIEPSPYFDVNYQHMKHMYMNSILNVKINGLVNNLLTCCKCDQKSLKQLSDKGVDTNAEEAIVNNFFLSESTVNIELCRVHSVKTIKKSTFFLDFNN